jgi:hypothetical protein
LLKFEGQWSVESEAPREIHIYGGVWASAEWDHYRAIRLHSLKRLLELSKAVESYAEIPSVQAWKTFILAITDDICLSVPFALGKVDINGNYKNASCGMALGGYSLLMGLRMIVTCLPKEASKMGSREAEIHCGNNGNNPGRLLSST